MDSTGKFLGLVEIAATPYRFDQTDEGFVVVDYSSYDLETGSFPRIKVKNASYLALKYLHSSEIERSVSYEEILSVVYQSEEDEFLAVLPQYQPLVTTVKSKWLKYFEIIDHIVAAPDVKSFFDLPLVERKNHRKAFAVTMKSIISDGYDQNVLFAMFKLGKSFRLTLADMIALRGADCVFKNLWTRLLRIPME